MDYIAKDTLWAWEEITVNATGAAVDADSAPTYEVFDVGPPPGLIPLSGVMVKRTNKTGHYAANFAVFGSGFVVGRIYTIVTTASVAGVVGKKVSGHFRIVAAEAAVGYQQAMLATGAITAGALTDAAVDKIHDEAVGDGSITFRQYARIVLADLAGRLSGAGPSGTQTITVRNVANTQNVLVVTADEHGNRTSVIVTP